MNRLILIMTFLCIAQTASANDSLHTLSIGNFLQIVKKFHPVARQADIQVYKADAELTAARSGFDPVVESAGGNKTFDGINYYRHNGVQLKIPTWYGIEFQTGIENLSGSRTNPENSLGKTSFAGISVPLAKNLLMDKRRAVLKQANIMVDASEQEKKIILNNLMKEASDTYWIWVHAHFNFHTFTSVLETNQKRINMVRTAFSMGEKAAIDTTEAMAQLQQFEYQQNEALVLLQNASLNLNNFLWKSNNEAYDIVFDLVKPEEKIATLFDAVMFPELEGLIDNALKIHPELVTYQYKLNFLHVEKRLKFQDLLPNIDLKYNQLGKGYDLATTTVKPLFDNNYRFGINFSMPLRMSAGRGNYKLAKLKITETKLDYDQKSLNLTNKIKAVYNQLVNYKTQVNLLNKTYANNTLLQKAEETRFFNGESSLFLVNTREIKAQETLLKLIDVTINYNKTENTLKWVAGILWDGR